MCWGQVNHCETLVSTLQNIGQYCGASVRRILPSGSRRNAGIITILIINYHSHAVPDRK